MALVGTTTVFSMTSSSTVTLVNCPGSSSWSGLGILALTENVPDLESTCGSAKSTSPL